MNTQIVDWLNSGVLVRAKISHYGSLYLTISGERPARIPADMQLEVLLNDQYYGVGVTHIGTAHCMGADEDRYTPVATLVIAGRTFEHRLSDHEQFTFRKTVL